MIAHRGIQTFALLFLGWNAGTAYSQTTKDELLDVVDFRNVSLHEAMRLLSMQTDWQIVPSAKAGKEKINLFLTNVRPSVVLAALADSNRFVLEEDKATGVISIFAKDERKETQVAGNLANSTFRPDYNLPDMTLRGVVVGNHQSPRAILEYEKKMITVSKGDMIALSGHSMTHTIDYATSRSDIKGGIISSRDSQLRSTLGSRKEPVRMRVVEIVDGEVHVEMIPSKEEFVIR